MGVELDVRVTGARELLRALDRFDRTVSQRATAQALNRTINNMRAVAIDRGARFLGVPKKDIERRFRFDIKNKHGAIGIVGARARVRMEAVAIARGRPFNLIRWNAQRVPGGVIADAWGETKFYHGLSITRAPAAFVFAPVKGAKGKGRIPTQGAYGPGLTHALEDEQIAKAIEREGAKRFEAHLRSAANYYLERDGWSVRF